MSAPLEMLLSMLDSADPDVRSQGVEIARAMGPAVLEPIFSMCHLTSEGLLWRPQGLSPELLTLLCAAPASTRAQVRQLVLMSHPSAPLLAQLSQFPELTALHLSLTPVKGPTTSPNGPRASLDLATLARLTSLRHLSLVGGTLDDLGALQALPLTSLSLRQVNTPEGALPSTLKKLELHEFSGTITNLSALPLDTLSAAAEVVVGQPWATRIPNLSVTHCTGGTNLKGLSITHLAYQGATAHFFEADHDCANLLAFPMLQSVHLPLLSDDASVHCHALHRHPTLEVVRVADNMVWPHDFPPHWVGTSDQYQRFGLWVVDGHPMQHPAVIARTGAYWYQRGHRYQLRCAHAFTNIIMAVKCIRGHLRIGLKPAKRIVDCLREDGLVCIPLSLALQLQGSLLNAGTRTEIMPWSPSSEGGL